MTWINTIGVFVEEIQYRVCIQVFKLLTSITINDQVVRCIGCLFRSKNRSGSLWTLWIGHHTLYQWRWIIIQKYWLRSIFDYIVYLPQLFLIEVRNLPQIFRVLCKVSRILSLRCAQIFTLRRMASQSGSFRC